MTKQTEKGRPNKLIRLRVKIQPGPASESQKQRYKRFWQKVIGEVKASER